VLLAIAPLYFLQWNLKARGGFVEHLVLLFVVMILFWRLYVHHERGARTAAALGLSAGIAFWVNQLVLAYLIVIGVLLALRWRDRRGWTVLLAGFVAGSILLIGYNVVHPLATFRTLARKAVVLNRVPIEERDERWVVRGVGRRVEALSQGADKLGIVFGVPPRRGVERLGLSEEVREDGTLTPVRKALAFVPAIVFGAALIALRPRRVGGRWVWPASDSLLLLFFLVTIAVGYVSPRYLLPAYPIAAVAAGAAVARAGARRGLLVAGVTAALAFNLSSWIDTATGAGRGDIDRIAGLIDTLERNGLTRCYTAGPMYHATFAARERIILSPLQKDRYPPYGDAVAASERICYVYRDDQADKRQHAAFARLLRESQVAFESLQAGPYNVLYDFRPRERITADAIAKVRAAETAHVSIGGMLDGLVGEPAGKAE
jgi:hypothetical protein